MDADAWTPLPSSHGGWVGRVCLVVVTAALLAGLAQSLLVAPDYRLLRLTFLSIALGLALGDVGYGVIAFVALGPLMSGVSRIGLAAHGLSFGQHMLIAIAFVAAARTLAKALPPVRSPVRMPLLMFVLLACATTLPTLMRKVGDASRMLDVNAMQAFSWIMGEAMTAHFLFRLSDWTRAHAWAVNDALLMVEGALVFWLVSASPSAPRGRQTRAALTFAAVGILTVGALQWFFPFNTEAHYNKLIQPNLFRINATLPDPNTLGAYIVLVSPLAALVIVQRFPIRRMAVATATAWVALSLWCLVLSNSRAAIVGLLIVFLAALTIVSIGPHLLGLHPARRFRVAAAAGVVLIVTAIAAISVYATRGGIAADVTYQTVSSRAEMALLTLDLRRPVEVIVTGRPQHWRPAIEMWRDAPWVGQGIGSYALLKNDYLPKDQQLPVFHSPHSYYVKILAEMGIVGVLALAALLAAIVVQTRRTWRGADAQGRQRVLAIGVGLAAFLIAMIVDEPIMVTEIQYVFWTMIALLVVEEREGRPAGDLFGTR